MKHFTCEQGSEEWFRLRLGIPTASEFHKIVTPTGKLSSQADGYMHWLLAEFALGCPLETTETEWMQRGHDLEDQAVRAYQFVTEREVQPAGFFTSDDGMLGASPDRLVGDEGLLEIKCPMPHTHVGYMLAKGADEKYKPQVQGQLWVCEREWDDIQSYYPALPTQVVRVTRDEAFISKLAEAMKQFVDRLLEARSHLEKRFGPFKRIGEPRN